MSCKLQRFIIIARFIIQLQYAMLLSQSIYTMINHLCCTVNHGCCCIKYLASCRLLCLYMYIPLIYQRPYQSVHTLSSDHLITRASLSHYHFTVAFIIKQSHVDLRFIARFNHLYNIIVALDRVNFVRSFFLCYFLA